MAEAEAICIPSQMMLEAKLSAADPHDTATLCHHRYDDKKSMAKAETISNPSQVKLEARLSTADPHDTATLCHHRQDESHKTKIKMEKPELKVKKFKRSLHCITCNFTAKTKKSYNRHTQSRGHMTKCKHNDDKCTICSAKALSDFKQCPMCNYTSDNSRSLKLHLNIHNKQGLPFKCSKCQYAAQNIKALIEHHRTANKNCSKGLCKYSTHKSEELKIHRKVCAWR